MFSDESIKNLKDSIIADNPATGPVDVQILPTPRCNANCAFCPLCAIPEHLMKHTPRFHTYKSDLPGGLIDRLADDLYHLGGLKRMTITGGEPLLYSFIVPVVYGFSNSFPDTKMTIVTNGIKLAPVAPFFVHLGVDNITVSINAGSAKSYQAQNPGAGSGVFDEVVAGVSALNEAKKKRGFNKPHVTLSAVLTRASAGDVEALFEIGKKTGADAVTYVPLMEVRLAGESVNENLIVQPDRFKKFLDDVGRFSEPAKNEGIYLGYAGGQDDKGVMQSRGLYRSQPCYSGHTFAAIYPNGDVRPCCHCESIMGNLQEASFIDIWTSKKYQEYRARMLNIQEHGSELDGCLCHECGYTYENSEFHRRLANE